MSKDSVCLRVRGNDGKPISEATLKRHFAHELMVGKVEVETIVLTQFMASMMRGERWAICKYMDQQMWRPESGGGGGGAHEGGGWGVSVAGFRGKGFPPLAPPFSFVLHPSPLPARPPPLRSPLFPVS